MAHIVLFGPALASPEVAEIYQFLDSLYVEIDSQSL